MARRSTIHPVMIGVVGFAAMSAAGQCTPQWQPGTAPPGIDGTVNAVAKWDPDGPGPLQAVLVAGGQFDVAGNVATKNVAAWDGVSWSPLGAGIPVPPEVGASRTVWALGVYNGELIAGVQARESNYGNSAYGPPSEVLFRWDGAAWVEAGTGIRGHVGGYLGYYGFESPPSVSAIAVYQGHLVVGGDFGKVNGQPANGLARWTGSWQPMGGVDGTVAALAVHQGQLYVGGSFASADGQPAANIARWNGFSWQPVGTGLGGGAYGESVRALTVYSGALVAAGRFAHAGGQAVNNVAWWTGSAWLPAGPGLPATGSVSSLTVYNGELIAGGSLSEGNDARQVQRWNGQVWQPAGGGMSDPFGLSTHVSALSVFKGALVAGGSFKSAGGRSTWNIAGWSGLTGQWRPLGGSTPGPVSGGGVHLLCAHDGGLVALSTFHVAGLNTVGVIRRAGASGPWQTLGLPSGFPYETSVNAGAEYAGDLVVAGNFSHMDGVPARRIARWDGAQWTPLQWGLTNVVRDLVVHGSDLIACGSFLYAGNQSAKRVARWDGASWHAMGGGLGGIVLSLAVYNGDVIAAGWISSAEGQPAKNLVRWNGTSWQTLGGGIDTGPSALAVHEGDLIVAGIAQGGTTSVGTIGRWNGFQWAGLGSDGPSNPYHVVSYRGELVTAGYEGVRSWNGSSWQFLGGEVGSAVSAASGLVVLDGDLFVGGRLAAAGGLVSYDVARWGCTCYADCNHNGFLGGGDYTCFNAMYAQGDPYADCDGDGQLTPADFVCFQAKFAQGCP